MQTNNVINIQIWENYRNNTTLGRILKTKRRRIGIEFRATKLCNSIIFYCIYFVFELLFLFFFFSLLVYNYRIIYLYWRICVYKRYRLVSSLFMQIRKRPFFFLFIFSKNTTVDPDGPKPRKSATGNVRANHFTI